MRVTYLNEFIGYVGFDFNEIWPECSLGISAPKRVRFFRYNFEIFFYGDVLSCNYLQRQIFLFSDFEINFLENQ